MSAPEMTPLATTLGKFCFLDFEYAKSEEAYLDLVCCSYVTTSGKTGRHWLYRDPDVQHDLATLLDHIGKDHVFACYAASAESRSFISLTLDPMDYKWVDLYVLWRQLQYCNEKHLYGRYLKKKVPKHMAEGFSVPPSMDKRDNKGRNNMEVGCGMADCVMHLLGVNLDAQHKTAMRNLIIDSPNAPSPEEAFTNDEKVQVQEYCNSDIQYLPQIMNIMVAELADYINQTPEMIIEIMIGHSRFAGPTMAHVENNGIPVDVEKIENLMHNVHRAKREMMRDYLAKVDRPFYRWDKDRLTQYCGKYVEDYASFEKYIIERYGFHNWPKTKSTQERHRNGTQDEKPDQLSRSNEDLKEYDGDPNIAAYRQIKKTLGGLQVFDPESDSAKEKGVITDSIGTDSRLRTMFGVLGTQTGRNAPRARKFIFAMGAWARSLIDPPKGHTVIGIDWKNQEFIIAGILSGDEAMMAAYASGDPYMWFAIAAGGAPEGATKSTHGDIRRLFKNTVLGLQFGMGLTRLARKLSVDCKREVTEEEAKRLINLHKRIFSAYWKWIERVVDRTYKRQGFITLWDGWSLLGDARTKNSSRNFPVQGTGAVLLRLATTYAIEAGLHVISPLHDAIYVLARNENTEEVSRILQECMVRAVKTVLGDEYHIRMDIEFHDEDHEWIEDKARDIYKAFKPYLLERETDMDRTHAAIKRMLDKKNYAA